MVFANGKDIQPDLFGQCNGFEQIVEPLRRADLLAGGWVGRQLDKGIEAEFKRSYGGGGWGVGCCRNGKLLT